MRKINEYEKKFYLGSGRKGAFYISPKLQAGLLSTSLLSSGISSILDLINQITFYEVNPELLKLEYSNYNNPSNRLYTKLGSNIYNSTIGIGTPFI